METIKNKLLHHIKKTITIDELTSLAPNYMTYDTFYEAVMALHEEGVLQEVKSAGNNGLSKCLYNKYRVNKALITEEKSRIINEKIFKTSPLISLEYYFGQAMGVYEAEAPFIERINAYLEKKGLPPPQLAPELSFELVGDEKWLEQKGGVKVLKHIGLWEQIQVLSEPDPVAFSIHDKLIHRKRHKHLIVENKTPYLHLMHMLEASDYNTVIYGQGWKIASGLGVFEQQYPFGQDHEFHYFGDVDREGIAILTHLIERYQVRPAYGFYNALINHAWVQGKGNQRVNDDSVYKFIQEMKQQPTISGKERIETVAKKLEEGCYLPQETLIKSHLEALMKRGTAND